MTDEMKLLRAFIETSGFSVAEVKEWFSFNSGDLKGGEYRVTDYKVTKKELKPACTFDAAAVHRAVKRYVHPDNVTNALLEAANCKGDL